MSATPPPPPPPVGLPPTPIGPPQKRKEFYQRWWFWVAAAFVVLIAIGASSGDNSSGSKSGSTSGGNDSGIGTGFGSQDASADVSISDCHDGGQYLHEAVTCTVSITNHSDGTSDYYIEGQALNGSTAGGGLTNASGSHGTGNGPPRARRPGLAAGRGG